MLLGLAAAEGAGTLWLSRYLGGGVAGGGGRSSAETRESTHPYPIVFVCSPGVPTCSQA